MKINKQKLKQIILEEIDTIEELETQKVSSSDVRSGAMAAAREQGVGLTDEERGLIQQLSAMLVAGGKKTNLLSGPLAQKVEQLIAVLQKVAGTQQGAEEEPV